MHVCAWYVRNKRQGKKDTTSGMRERNAFLYRNVKNMTNYVLHIWGTKTPKNQAPFLSYRCTSVRPFLSRWVPVEIKSPLRLRRVFSSPLSILDHGTWSYWDQAAVLCALSRWFLVWVESLAFRCSISRAKVEMQWSTYNKGNFSDCDVIPRYGLIFKQLDLSCSLFDIFVWTRLA